MHRLTMRARARTTTARPLRLLAPFARWWWLAALVVLVVLVVAAGALWRDLGPAAPHRYLATRRFAVVIPPPVGAVTSYAAYLARVQQERVARVIAQGDLLAAAKLARAVAAEAEADTKGRQRFAARDVAEALAATHTGNVVTLVARWPTAAGASALVATAGEAVAQEAAAGTLPVGDAAPPRLRIRLEPMGAVSAPTLDPAVEAALRGDLLARIMGVLAASLLLVKLAEWLRRRSP